MGVPILSVMVFRWVHNPVGPLNIGYVGVDIFLFLSGLGLARLYRRNTVPRFYKRRLRRVYPLCLVGVAAAYLLFRFLSLIV